MARVRNTFWRKQIDKLIQSENIPVVFKQYINFGTTGGDTGYGFRDNAGVIQFKNESGSWADLGTGGGGGAVDSVNGQTGVVVLDADDIDDTSTTNKFTTASDISKLAGIEAGADVTDTANVTAAGALMDSEVTNLAAVKAFNPTDYAPALGADDNYVTDAQKTIIAATTASYTTAEATKLGYISVTQAVDLDQIESDTVTNNAKVTNATHTGEVTGSGALTVDKTAITNKPTVTVDNADYVLISDSSDSGNLKKVLASGLTGGGGGGGISEELALYYAIAF